MNLKIADSWLREYLKTTAKAHEIAEVLSLSGLAVESLDRVGNEDVYNLEITSNRIDAACVIGVAREAYAALKQHHYPCVLKISESKKPKGQNEDKLPLIIKDPHLLSRKIMAVVLDGFKVGPSAAFVKQRLNNAGIRSLNNLVDVTNYLMLEVGHPAHIFDYDRIGKSTLLFRYAKDGETITTLDGVKHRLNRQDVIIEDGLGRIVDFPGIMGAENSMVAKNTKRAILFIEMNDPVQIRHSSMRHALRTLAASYNENSPDKQTAENAFYRGIALLQKWSGAKIASSLINIDRIDNKPKKITFLLEDIERYLMVKLKPKQVIAILVDLGFKLQKQNGHKLTFLIPSFRQKDIDNVTDIIEEIGRIYGLHNLKSSLPPFVYHDDDYIHNLNDYYQKEALIRNFLTALGFFEVCNYSMLDQKLNRLFDFGSQKAIKMDNPISAELVYFRKTLLSSLTKAALLNAGYGRLNLFEVGQIYLPRPKDLPEEKPMLGLYSTCSYFQLKGVFEALANYGHYSSLLTANPGTSKTYLDQKQSVTFYLDNLYLGELGLLSPQIGIELNMKKIPVVAEFDLVLLTKYFQILKPIAKTLSERLVEDLTYLFDNKHYYSSLVKTIKTKFKRVKKIEFISQYQNYYTIRLYTETRNGKSILPLIIEFLEKELSLKIKRAKVDKNMS